jgi:hypothetical protein
VRGALFPARKDFFVGASWRKAPVVDNGPKVATLRASQPRRES